MAYDVLIRNGRIVDGSGMPAFHGDIAVKDGKIAEIGKLSGVAGQTIDAEGRAVSPGFIDNHCHYDAQVTWDPLCSFSCDHGATSVVIGNCSLSLAPVRRGKEKRMAEFLSYVEAIPMEVLNTVEVDWESFPQYMERLDHNLGVNVGTLIGHTAVRYYVMDEDCQKRTATDDELKQMQEVVRDGMEGGALGLSVSRNKGHYDPQGVHIPALWADEKEIFAVADVLRELGTGIIQSGGGRDAELKSGLMARLAEATGRPVVYNNLGQTVRRPDEWKQHMARVDETVKAGIRAYPLCSPNRVTQQFTMKNAQLFRGSPTWHPILLSSDEEKLRAYADPEVRRKLHEEMIEWKVEIPGGTIARNWYDYVWVDTPVLEKHKWMIEKSIREIAEAQGKGIIDAFLDLVVEEKLETGFMQAENNVDDEAMRQILTYPNALIGLSDGGAHVQFHGGYGFSTRLLGEWVRDRQAMTLEQAVRRLTFDSASTFGLYDRGLLRPGMAADITIFDPDTVKPLPEYVVHDFPAGGWRFKEPAQGIYATFVNGRMLMKEGEHTGALPGRVLRNSRHRANHGA
ncbi:MAG: amidohydrolase family protein [Alphaproteobacteria bacterium]|nr:amidohydrolase family protein [Alphaproteobacteria bacterium]